MGSVEVQKLGIQPYSSIWQLQGELIQKRAEEEISDTLLVLEHDAVITLGRKTPGVRENEPLPERLGEIPVFAVERGGEATYHGPGQLVMYPIFKLDLMKTGPRVFLRLMEEAIITALSQYNLKGYWLEGKTGVWLKDSQGRERKIASLGIAVRRGVSYHGLALNINNDLRPFTLIQPCGFAPEVMTNMKEQVGKEIPVLEVAQVLGDALIAYFQKAMGPKQ